MTRKEAERLTHQENVLMSLGFTREQAEALRRISMTLHSWAEHECNGAIQRDGDDGKGAPCWYNTNTGQNCGRVPDRERGALKRLKAIIAARNERYTNAGNGTEHLVSSYVQGDPRGCALYILRSGDVPDGERADSYYSRGIAVY